MRIGVRNYKKNWLELISQMAEMKENEDRGVVVYGLCCRAHQVSRWNVASPG